MDLALSNDTVATVIAIIAPGYFAVQAYAAVNAKPEKNFSRTLIESIAFGFLIISLYNFCIHAFRHIDKLDQLNIGYFLPLLVVSPLAGTLVGITADTTPLRWIRKKLRLPGPDDDYLRVLFKGLATSSIVTVSLKSGEIFSGTPEGWSVYVPGVPQRIYFNNIAWYQSSGKRHRWQTRNGSIVIAVDDIAYMETDAPLLK